jgi:hypothetical protein
MVEMTRAEPRWVLVQSDGPQCAKVTFQLAPSRFWPPDILRHEPINPVSLAGRNVTIGGPGAVWMYAHVAALAVEAHARSVCIKQADESETFVYPVAPGAPGTLLPWIEASQNRLTGLTLVFRARTDQEGWPSTVLNDLPSLLLGNEQTLCLTGPGANWMYGAAAASGVTCGSRLITCFSPRQNAKAAIVVYDVGNCDRVGTLVPCPGEFLDYRAKGLILGIVGDPNSGKSVLARSLEYIRKQETLDGWIVDCDGCSPTPNWYLQMVQGGREEECRRLRSSQKRSWSPEMASSIAEHLRNLRQSFTLVIADLPGGNHSIDPPERIPDNELPIMQEIDAFIILGRENSGGAQAWQRALAEVRLDSRIAAIWTSAAPEEPPSINLTFNQNPCSGVIRGLNRNNSPGVLAAALRPALGIWLRRLVGSHAPTGN